jgi:hypothetical protein
MNRHQKPLPHRIKSPAYRQAFERLDAALEENTPFDNTEKIRLMRKALFASVDELEKSGTINIPKQAL